MTDLLAHLIVAVGAIVVFLPLFGLPILLLIWAVLINFNDESPRQAWHRILDHKFEAFVFALMWTAGHVLSDLI